MERKDPTFKDLALSAELLQRAVDATNECAADILTDRDGKDPQPCLGVFGNYIELSEHDYEIAEDIELTINMLYYHLRLLVKLYQDRGAGDPDDDVWAHVICSIVGGDYSSKEDLMREMNNVKDRGSLRRAFSKIKKKEAEGATVSLNPYFENPD